MLYFIVFILLISVFMLIYGLLTVFYKDKISVGNRIEQIKEYESLSQEDEKNKGFSERALKPVYQNLSQLILKLTPKYKVIILNKKFESAGLLKNRTIEKWLFRKSMIIAIISVFFSLLVYSIDQNILKTIVIAFLIIAFGNAAFNFYVSSRIEARRKAILKDLPYTLDLITVSVEAGLSFDGAISRVVNNINGELCDEFAKSLKEMRMGIDRKIALKNMGERCKVKELSMLITSIVQADELGVSLGKVLRIEASNLREHRKQIAREKAMKAPIKMLFPLLFFIFPSIFIIILGPAVIKIFNVFLR